MVEDLPLGKLLQPKQGTSDSKKKKKYVSKKIQKLIHEGYPQKQAAAIAYSMAEKKK